MRKLLLLLLIGVLASASLCYSQTIQRSSIGILGSSNSSEGITVQQTVGQPYQTKSYYSKQIEARPGFIQPTEFMLEFVQSTFTVEMLVFPNPTLEHVKFQTNERLENLVLRVFDQYGKMIFQEEIEVLNDYTLECSAWMSGSYFIYITDETGNNYQSKLIKR